MSTLIDASKGAGRHLANSLIDNYKLTPATLYSRLDPTWMAKPFLLYASMKIAQCIARGNGRLIISWPPRHGKSRLATIATPIWVLENYPQYKIMLASYGADLSVDFGREIKDIIKDNQHLLNVRIRQDVRSNQDFKTESGGGMLSVGVGGPIVGKGANVFLIDDYIKTMEEAESVRVREKIWEWWAGTAYHRLEPGGSMIIIATRWPNIDLIGRIKREFGEYWEEIRIPALAEKDDLFGRKPGEALFPERFTREDLLDRQRVLGSRYFNALYQQNPDDENSKLTSKEWIELVTHVPNAPRMAFARIWDFAGTKGGGDWTVGTLVCGNLDTQEFFILNIHKGQWSAGQIELEVKKTAAQDGIYTPIIIEQEPGASGVQLLHHMKTNVLPTFNVIGAPTTLSKVVRAQPFIAAAEAHRVKMLAAPWNDSFLKEFDEFPGDGGDYHDDQVDTCAIGYNTIFATKPSSATWGRDTKPGPKVFNNRPFSAELKPQPTAGTVWGRR